MLYTRRFDWLEALWQTTDDICFLALHPPVVPYGGARTWHLYSQPKQKAQRERLLELLRTHVFVLSGHIHKYSTLVREGRAATLLQLALSSVIHATTRPRNSSCRGKPVYFGPSPRGTGLFTRDGAGATAFYVAEAPW